MFCAFFHNQKSKFAQLTPYRWILNWSVALYPEFCEDIHAPIVFLRATIREVKNCSIFSVSLVLCHHVL